MSVVLLDSTLFTKGRWPLCLGEVDVPRLLELAAAAASLPAVGVVPLEVVAVAEDEALDADDDVDVVDVVDVVVAVAPVEALPRAP